MWSSSTESGVMSPSPKPNAWTDHQEVTEIELNPINMNREDGLVFRKSQKPLIHSLKEQRKKIITRLQDNSTKALFRVQRSDSFHLTFFSLFSLLNFPVKSTFLDLLHPPTPLCCFSCLYWVIHMTLPTPITSPSTGQLWLSPSLHFFYIM